jgi:hypothetical protein
MNWEILYTLILGGLIVIAILLGFNLLMDRIEDDKYIQDKLDEMDEKLENILKTQEKKNVKRKNSDK